MGFDDVDRHYAARKPVQLECELCGTTDDGVRRREHWYYTDQERVVCVSCWSRWTPQTE